MSVLSPDRIKAAFAAVRAVGADLVKASGDARKVHALSGQLYLSQSGWLLLSVPNALVRGAFDALAEVGAELPPSKSKGLNAHISVMRPEELERIGGPDVVTERGHTFRYTLGPLKEVEPAGWKEMSKVWFVEVSSPELEKFRKSYGLSATPMNGEHEFHITIAVRRKRVTHPGDDVTKQSAEKAAMDDYYANGDHHWYCQACQDGFDTDDATCPKCGADCVESNRRRKSQVLRRRNGLKAWYCETCLVGFDEDPPANKCPECSGDPVPYEGLNEKNKKRLEKTAAMVSVGEVREAGAAARTERLVRREADAMDGIRVLFHPGPPAKAYIDVMDWGDGKVGKILGDRLAKVLGRENVEFGNESSPEGDGWKKVAFQEGMEPHVLALQALDDIVVARLLHRRQQQKKQQQPAPVAASRPGLPGLPAKAAGALEDLREAKRRSDRRDYKGKAALVRKVMRAGPKDWAVDSEASGVVGVTHLPTKFRLHLPARDVHDLRHGFSSLAKAAGAWDGDPPAVVELSLRGGDQAVCPRCGRAIEHDLYTDKKGWKFHRSCFGKGKGPVTPAVKTAISTAMVERARAALLARPDGAARAARFEAARRRWLIGPARADGLPGGHFGRSLRAVGRGDTSGVSEAINTLGAAAGTGHKRLAVPAAALREDGLKRLGFESVRVAIPETGQTRFSSLRHPANELHLHPHAGYWTIHEDEHPSVPMALRRATTVPGKGLALAQGMRHVLGEGVPGFYTWARNLLTNGRSMLHSMHAERPDAFLTSGPVDLPAWQPGLIRRNPRTTATAAAVAGGGLVHGIRGLTTDRS